MEEEKLKYYKISKFPCYEILMEGQIASAGAHQAKLIEKFKKNKKYIKNQFLALKIVFSFLFTFFPLLPLIMYFQVTQNPDQTYTPNTISFVSSFIFGIFFAVILLYLIMFGLVSTSSFMSGNSFKWLQTLPFSKKQLKKIGFMTIFRNLDLPLIVLIFSSPIIMLIATQNFLIFITMLLVSFVNVVFCFSLLVIIGEKMSFIFSESKGKSKKVNIVRMLTMISYFVIAFASGFIITWGFNSVDTLLVTFTNNEPSDMMNIIFSLIPYPFAPGYLISLSSMPNQVPLGIIGSTIIGFALFILITVILFRTAQRALRSTISTEIKVEEVEKREIEVEVTPKSPILAYLRKDLISTTRDLQSFMFIFFPLFYPLILILTMQVPINMAVTSIEGILILWSIVLAVYLFIPPMLIVGFLNIEESGSSTIASLPILPREQAKAKIILMLSIQGISIILSSIVLMLLTGSIIILILFLVSLPIAWTLLLFMFEMKIRLFGKIKYKYIIEELNKEHKVGKWILMLVSLFLLYVTISIAGNLLFYIFGIITALIALGIIGLIGVSSLIFVFTRMFPKVEKMREYVTGGLLRENVNIGTIFLMILYLVFGLLVIPLQLLFLPIILNLNLLGLLFFQFILSFSLTALLWLVLVPLGLKLPKRESFREFTQTIGLSTVRPIWRNVLLGISNIMIIGFSLILFGNLLGKWTLNWNVLFGFPSITTGLGWFLLILAIIPGIWEEVAFRGVILNLQLKKYSHRTSIISNGVLFGLFHLTNLILGANLFLTFMQVIYASCIGISFAYMYTRTRSLLPCILTHYLLDSVGQLFLFVSIPNNLNLALYLIFGLGVIPMIFIIALTKLLVKQNSRM
ncbi:MAG: type II CAAX prenyl endopeptidase Rce1 family protein [Promethearchaeota archaeon]